MSSVTVRRVKAVTGLFYITGISSLDVTEWFESVRHEAEPVPDMTGKVGKNPRYRLDYGKKYLTRGDVTDAPPMPDPLFDFVLYCDSIVQALGIEDLPDKVPDQCLINIYAPKQKISAHIDSTVHFGSVIFCATFGSTRTMRFTCDEQTVDIETEPNSLYVMSGDARYKWKHEMLPAKNECYSITARYML